MLSPFLQGISDQNEGKSIVELPMNQFMEAVSDFLVENTSDITKETDLEKYPLLPGQGMYVMDYFGKKISYQRNIQSLLGYDPDEFDFDMILSYFDASQKDILQRIIKGAINFGIAQKLVNKENAWLIVTYKARKKDGSFIPLIRHTCVNEKDKEGRMLSTISIISDLSGMNMGDKVEWKLRGPRLDEELFAKYIYDALSGLFSDRELEVLEKLEKGEKSKTIADELFISKNTVDTHRRNMLRKSGCQNTAELLNFARKNGFIS